MDNAYGSSDFPLFGAGPEDTGEWQSPSFFGDYYREPDNVSRGLTLPTGEVSGSIPYKGFADADYYREPDDICKGVSLGFSLAPPLSKEFGLSSNLGFSSTVPAQKAVDERFDETDFPPNAPTDSFFKFEATTLYVNCSAPFQIANHLLDFFNQEVASAIEKTRRPKFSIKLDIFADSMMCTMKVRVYNQGSGQFAVEFQRRTGDTIAFCATFQKASAYLKRFFTMADHSSPAEASPMLISFEPPMLPEGLAQEQMNEADLLPLLDMTGLVGAPWLQAEAAVSLSKMAAEGKEILWSTQVFQGIEKLLEASSPEVAQPTARLLYNLAQHVEAAPFFAAHGLSSKMIEKAGSQETQAQVRLLLEQALNAAGQKQSKGFFSDNGAAELYAPCVR